MNYSLIYINNYKAPERATEDWIQTNTLTPGPGYYETPSTFDFTLNHELALQNIAAQKRQMAIFESKTYREFPLSKREMMLREVPGPADYVLPELFKPVAVPPSKQCFDSKVERFKDVSFRLIYYVPYVIKK